MDDLNLIAYISGRIVGLAIGCAIGAYIGRMVACCVVCRQYNRFLKQRYGKYE